MIVSRVAGGTPADKCVPRLNEGDQVVLINGRDVSTMTHDQVVNFIRAAREPHSGQLILAVRQVRIFTTLAREFKGSRRTHGDPELSLVNSLTYLLALVPSYRFRISSQKLIEVL